MRTYERFSWWWVMFIAITVMLQFQMKGSCEGCVETERIGLLQLKSYLNSLFSPKEKNVLEPWSDDDYCNWERVKCSDSGHVVDLSLDGFMPSNQYPLNLSLLHSFPQLKTLNFSYNGFTHVFDPIHGYKSFQRLEKLRTLDFCGNLSILLFLRAARSLRTLNLGNNYLKGVFPPNGYKTFQNLETLDLSVNRLNNRVFPFLSGATSLRNLNLGLNHLDGVIPPNELANMTKLKVLNLGYNEFSFFSGQGLINLRELEVLDLSYNYINDSEAGYVLRDMRKLQELALTGNDFTDLDSLGKNKMMIHIKTQPA